MGRNNLTICAEKRHDRIFLIIKRSFTGLKQRKLKVITLTSTCFSYSRLIALLRILIVYPGSEYFHPGSRVKKIPDPRSASASKNLSIFNPKIVFKALGNMFWDVNPRILILIFYPSRIPGSRLRIQGPGSGSMQDYHV
jgi:hypothetical protein